MASTISQEKLASPEDSIIKTVNAIREAEGTDTELLDILSKNILIMSPSNTAVNDAVLAIERLAMARAEILDSDTADHD
jgi:hypothetical protein